MFKSPFSFKGRIRRIEYLLSCLLGGVVFSFLFWSGVGASLVGAETNSGGGTVIGMLISLFAIIGGLWFSIAQNVKRLHDVDKSGWLIILLFIPIIGFIWGLYMLLADGTVGPNRYGMDPKNRMPYYPQPPVNVTVNMNGETQKTETSDTQPKQIEN